MTAYPSGRTSGFLYFIKSWLSSTALMVLLTLLLDILYSYFDLQPSTWWPLVAFYSVAHLIQLTSYTWINEVHIHPVERKLLVRYYNVYEGKTCLVLPFEKIKIRINRRKPFKRKNILSVSIIQDEAEAFDISRTSGYNTYTLNKMAAQLETLTHPIP